MTAYINYSKCTDVVRFSNKLLKDQSCKMDKTQTWIQYIKNY